MTITSNERSRSQDLYKRARTFLEEKRFADALPLLEAAVIDKPDSARIQIDLGVALAKLSRHEAAIAAFRRGLAIEPDNATAHNNLVTVLIDHGDMGGAVSCLQDLVRIRPESAQAAYDLGNLLRKQGSLPEAATAFQEALVRDPKHVYALHDLGLSQAEMGQLKEAEASYRAALILKPDFPPALCNLGVVLEDQGRLDEAIQAFRETLKFNPKSDDTLNNLGVALAAQGKFKEAIKSYRKALAVNPNSAISYNNIGNALRSLGSLEEADLALRRAIELRSDYAEAHNNLGINLVAQRRATEAMQCYEQALRLRPHYAEAHLNRALAWLAAGDFERGWLEYEWRWKGPHLQDAAQRTFRPGRWDGGSLEGRTILLTFEQGLGDTLQFIRYAPALKQRGARVVVDCQPGLRWLLADCPGVDEIVTKADVRFDCHAPLMSLPGKLKTTLSTIPANVPYLPAKPEAVEAWGSRLKHLDGFRVGIAWQGNPKFRADRHRSMALQNFAPLSEVPGVQLISLQKGLGTEQLDNIKDPFTVHQLADFDNGKEAFVDTVPVLKNLDLVITSDTALCHLAGGLGVPVWVALPFAADWRWLQGRSDSPWYPSMRLFRQNSPDSWPEVFQRITTALREKVTTARQGNTPVEKSGVNVRGSAKEQHREGLRHMRAGKPKEAAKAFQRAIAMWDDFAEAHHDLGVAFAYQKKLGQASEAFRRALQLRPAFSSAHGNLGMAELEQGNLESAAHHLARAIEGGPSSPEMYHQQGVVFMKLGRPHEALESFRRALLNKPDFAKAHYNLAWALLSVGQFEQGWLEFEWRAKSENKKPPKFRKPQWTGGPLDERTIFVHSGESPAEIVHFARYANVLKKMGGRIFLECPPKLAPLLTNCQGVDRVISAGERVAPFDYHVSLSTLPGILKTTLANLPSEPYLMPSPELTDTWRDRLAKNKCFKIGIVWQSDMVSELEGDRSIPFDCFQSLTQSNVQLIPLQKFPADTRVSNQKQKSLFDFGKDVDAEKAIESYPELAAIISQLDLVVAADSTIARIAGAIGVPVWLALPRAADWLWLIEREDSPWYPTMRLFRQSGNGDWGDVFEKIGEALRERVGLIKNVNAPSDVNLSPMEWHRAGIERFKKGDVDQSILSFKNAIAGDSSLTAAHHDLGVAYARQKEFLKAIDCFREAVSRRRDFVTAHSNLVQAYLDSNDIEAAEEALLNAVQANPLAGRLHLQMGGMLNHVRRANDALIYLERALSLGADLFEIHSQRGNSLIQLGNFVAAEMAYEEAIVIRPELPDAYYFLGMCLGKQDRHEEAVKAIRKAIQQKPDYVQAYVLLAEQLVGLDDLDGAEKELRRALYLQSHNAEIHQQLGIVLILKGEFENGWLEYEWRKKGVKKDTLKNIPFWDGSPLQGRRLLIQSDQGLSDTIQFLRYAPLLKKSGATVTLACQPSLHNLLRGQAGIDELISNDEPCPRCDVMTPILSLPMFCRTTLENIPQNVPYLHVADPLVADWNSRLKLSGSLKVGLAWDTNLKDRDNHPESVVSKHLLSLSSVEEVGSICLHYGDSGQRNPSVPDVLPVIYPADFVQGKGDFLDIAAIMRNLDLVITSDSVIAHLAGALGIPVWVVLCRNSHWRWLRHREDSPWYPTMRLFRQIKRNDWADVFARLTSELVPLAREKSRT